MAVNFLIYAVALLIGLLIGRAVRRHRERLAKDFTVAHLPPPVAPENMLMISSDQFNAQNHPMLNAESAKKIDATHRKALEDLAKSLVDK